MAAARRAVGVEPEDLQRREHLRQLGLDPLGPGPDPRDRHRGAFGARLGLRLGVAAVVTAQCAVAVQDERDVAVGALPGVAAGSAGEVRRPAAPVDQQDRLASLPRDLVERLAGPRVKRPGDAAPHVDDLHRRQRPAVDAAGQLEPLELMPALGPRRRRAAEQHCAGVGGAPPRDLPRVVAGIALLLVGGVVLLVDHDQAEIPHRGEDDRARPDADPRLAGAQAAPLVVARAGGHPRVEQGDRVAEAATEAIHGLRRERDLGHEHDRPAAARERLASGLQVHLGLSRAGDAVEQEGMSRRTLALVRERRDHRPERGPLVARQLDALADRAHRGTRCAGGGAPPPGSRPARGPPAGGGSTGPSRRSRRAGGQPWDPPRERGAPLAVAARAGRRAEIASSPFSVACTSSSTSGRTRRASAPVPTPGGSTRPSPRAVVEQYSSPTQRPSPTSSGGTPASSASSGSARRSCGRSLRSASPTTTPTTRRRPNGTTRTDPTSTPLIASGRR